MKKSNPPPPPDVGKVSRRNFCRRSNPPTCGGGQARTRRRRTTQGGKAGPPRRAATGKVSPRNEDEGGRNAEGKEKVVAAGTFLFSLWPLAFKEPGLTCPSRTGQEFCIERPTRSSGSDG